MSKIHRTCKGSYNSQKNFFERTKLENLTPADFNTLKLQKSRVGGVGLRQIHRMVELNVVRK